MNRILHIIILALASFSILKAQDSLTVVQLESITYAFDVKDGKLTGKGKAFLEQELAQAQFTMIGEYHGSKRISEFTNAIIPVLDRHNYKTMALEVGPVVGGILNSFKDNVAADLKSIHNKYYTKETDGTIYTSFPFFDTEEDAAFLQTAKDNSWNVFGIDQEYYDSYVMLADKMYNNLSEQAQKAHSELYMKTVSKLKKFYKDDADDKKNLHVAIAGSQLYNKFISVMASEAKNLEIIEALAKSSDIYMLNEQKKWYENNATRIRYMKSRLNAGLARLNFNVTTDKLLIKMGGYHLSKGFSPLGLYEVGNTLNEIAEYNGNTALNIGFISRYSMDKDTVVDNYESKNTYYKNHKQFLQMGKKDEWVVIDLRRLIKEYFYYPKKFSLNKQMVDLVQRYDLLIIPKMEVAGTPNFDLNSN
jgi:hypothetical protein